MGPYIHYIVYPLSLLGTMAGKGVACLLWVDVLHGAMCMVVGLADSPCGSGVSICVQVLSPKEQLR